MGAIISISILMTIGSKLEIKKIFLLSMKYFEPTVFIVRGCGGLETRVNLYSSDIS